MFKYAVINEDGICTAVSYLAEEVQQENMILLHDNDDVSLWDIYSDGGWAPGKPPLTSGDSLQDKMGQLEADNKAMMLALADIYEQMIVLRSGGNS
ncbi:hypothetical protein DNH61_07820 [Paenibacillus sambharensis]|uniref:Uncharacterized protein n=1 Tax=Paenibacillus sambharensis TaxID=1803190 RepID=A0A2W1L8B7_9BACL|nr:hypothetical protein [Paenibacillus sambharensis]PZD96408.1 hypothetical protein DNH61_07820 [Paenibacillus sambharensis]